jgi:hypothetical protein
MAKKSQYLKINRNADKKKYFSIRRYRHVEFSFDKKNIGGKHYLYAYFNADGDRNERRLYDKVELSNSRHVQDYKKRLLTQGTFRKYERNEFYNNMLPKSKLNTGSVFFRRITDTEKEAQLRAKKGKNYSYVVTGEVFVDGKKARKYYEVRTTKLHKGGSVQEGKNIIKNLAIKDGLGTYDNIIVEVINVKYELFG